jgi:hypothetical protein
LRRFNRDPWLHREHGFCLVPWLLKNSMLAGLTESQYRRELRRRVYERHRSDPHANICLRLVGRLWHCFHVGTLRRAGYVGKPAGKSPSAVPCPEEICARRASADAISRVVSFGATTRADLTKRIRSCAQTMPGVRRGEGALREQARSEPSTQGYFRQRLDRSFSRNSGADA